MTASVLASVDIGSEQATTYHFLYVNAEMSDIPLISLVEGHFAVELASIPEPYRTEFKQYLRGAQMPVVDGHGPCAYLGDFNRWVGAQRIAGRI